MTQHFTYTAFNGVVVYFQTENDKVSGLACMSKNVTHEKFLEALNESECPKVGQLFILVSDNHPYFKRLEQLEYVLPI